MGSAPMEVGEVVEQACKVVERAWREKSDCGEKCEGGWVSVAQWSAELFGAFNWSLAQWPPEFADDSDFYCYVKE